MGPLSFVLFWNSVQVSVEVSPIRSVFCASLVLSEDWRLIGCSRGACDQSAVGARGLGVTEVPSGGSDDRHLLYSTPDTMDMTSDWYIVFLVCFGSRLIMIRGRLAQSAEALSEHNINGQQIILSVWHSQFVKLCIHVNVIVNCLDVVFLSFRSMQVSQRTHTHGWSSQESEPLLSHVLTALMNPLCFHQCILRLPWVTRRIPLLFHGPF